MLPMNFERESNKAGSVLFLIIQELEDVKKIQDLKVKQFEKQGQGTGGGKLRAELPYC